MEQIVDFPEQTVEQIVDFSSGAGLGQGSSSSAGPADEDFTGGFSHFSPWKKVRSAGQEVSAQLGGHVSSSMLSAHQMARARRAVDSVGSDEWVLMRTPDIGKSYYWNRRTRLSSWSPPEGITVVWVGTRDEEGVFSTGTGIHVSVRIHSFRCFLGDGLRGEGLGIPSPLLGCHQVRGAHRAPGYRRPCDYAAQVPAFLRERGGASVSVPRQCSNFQLCFRGVYGQCKLCKSWRFHRAVLRHCLRALCCALTGAGDGPDSAENREVSARVLGQGCLARCDARQGVVQTVQKTVKIPHAFLDMVLARRCCNDRYQMVETVQKTVESPQLVLPLSVSVDGRLSQRRWFLRCHGLRAILATATLLRRTSLSRF